MEKVTNYILQQVATNHLPKEEAKVLLKDLHQENQNTDIISKDIAIIGMACKLPGAENLEEYWNNLVLGVRTMGDFSFNRRRDTDPFIPPDVQYRKGGYLNQVDRFDAPFFRISRREAETMDPMQRLFLETAWEAMEDSGIGSERLSGTKTAVYVGQETNYNNEYRKLLAEEDELSMTGSHTGIISSRIQYLLNLKGPSLVLDTACSSSLVALHLACQGLRNNEFEHALVGGISAFFFPAGQGLVMESGEAEIRAFDSNAKGTCWSEGFGVVMLKPLDKALRDHDHIHGIIKGSAMNNDGTSNGITAPNADSQAEVLTSAWEASGIPPESISYIEAHGTGTPLGDPIEIKGLTKAFSRYTNKRQFCGIGSVKTNIGHAVATSGIASLIKVVLAMKHKKLPKTLSFEAPNTYINFAESPVYVNDRLREWETDGTPRRSGVSAFGFSGTNVHVVLEEAPIQKSSIPRGGSELFMISARTETALRKLLRNYTHYLRDHPNVSLTDLCYTVNTGRRHYPIRLAFLVETAEELLHKLWLASINELNDIPTQIPYSYYGSHKLIFHMKEKKDGELTENDILRLSEGINGDLEELVSSGISKDSGEQIALAYISGARIEWNVLYKQTVFYSLPLPTYPFDKLRYWANGEHLLSQKMDKIKILNTPLLDRYMGRVNNESIYETDFNIERHWELREHVIDRKAVLPGTAYVEMALEASKHYLGVPAGGVEEVQFLFPFVVDEGETKMLRTTLFEEDRRLLFTISSRAIANTSDEDWSVHAMGELITTSEMKQTLYDLGEIALRCSEVVRLNDAPILPLNERSIDFGPRFQNIVSLRTGKQEALVELELPDEFSKEIEDYQIHPALLDKATGAVSDLLAGEGDLYLAFTYSRLRIFKHLPKSIISYVRKLETNSRELLIYEVKILDKQGNLLAEIEKFTVKRLNGKSQSLLDPNEQAPLFHEIGWKEVEHPNPKTDLNQEKICILRGRSSSENELVERLRSEGCLVLEVEVSDQFIQHNDSYYTVSGSEEDYLQLFMETRNMSFSKIVHLCTLRQSQVTTYDEIHLREQHGVYDLFRITRALEKSRRPEINEIVLVSDNAWEVTSQETMIQPINAALFGLGRVVVSEYPGWNCRAIDFDETAGANELLLELSAGEYPYAVAYRDGKRYVEEISPCSQESDLQEVELKENGVYVISGGTGGIGLEVARWLAVRQKIKLVLLHRSPFPDQSQWPTILENSADEKMSYKLRLLQDIENIGSQVLLVRADVEKQENLRLALQEIRTLYGPIRGVIHSAGVAGDGFLIRKEESSFREVFDPKVKGTLLLDDLTREDKLDFFVMFSSVTAFLAGPGQGDYTAANAFLDSFAAYREKQGSGRTLTINWPSWKEIGMAVDYGVNHDGVFKSITTKEALAGFGTALQSPTNRVIIGELNYDLIQDNGQGPMLMSDEITMRLKRQGLKRNHSLKTDSKDKKLRFITLEGRTSSNYSETENQLAAVWGKVLGVERINIQDNFYSLGGDSILAIQIVSTIAEHMNEKISITDLLEHDTIDTLANYMNTLPSYKAKDLSAKIISPVKEEALLSDDQSLDVPVDVPEQESIDLSTYEKVQELSWRQLNCYDRGFAIQFGNEYSDLIPYFKLFMGMKRGYNLASQGYPYSLRKESHIFGYETDYQLLEKFGFYIKQTPVNHISKIHETIRSLLIQKKPVMVGFDEFYSFYTPFYLKEHTSHLTVITGYDEKSKNYSIINHNHLQTKPSSLISYGPFRAPYSTLEEIYSGLPTSSRVLITLERNLDSTISVESIRQELQVLLKTLLEEEQVGSEIELMTNWNRIDADTEEEKIRELYILLGGKELFLTSLTNDFLQGTEQHLETKEASETIIDASANFVSKFVSRIFRKQEIDYKEIDAFSMNVRKKTSELLSIALEQLT
ncbi:polyketide synthase PksN [Paenibacillus sp. CF095]|uniref:SDR family NAD(P)-dependent oxidoreductase n=1 Tax=Paenibacillus sp. CF095 TaxID=1881033 RepID=UPI00088EE831|nr:SDR family NAD(P)-dependent oxidoreductase [Paenibacillus sp. CF095]SDD50816.1 polyketide synthase PksN [Paenibacillus sp. CF095]